MIVENVSKTSGNTKLGRINYRLSRKETHSYNLCADYFQMGFFLCGKLVDSFGNEGRASLRS